MYDMSAPLSLSTKAALILLLYMSYFQRNAKGKMGSPEKIQAGYVISLKFVSFSMLLYLREYQ